ncbi:MAG: beta-ketoacyl-ACP synthase I [Candidatus Pacebacteria bacterium]|nr:beta-ketoacyl-ACP synthase I [Candidatus Paceibacterota bacterium]
MTKRRVVITGQGLISSIGNSIKEVTDSLFLGKSGIEHCAEYKEIGMASQVIGKMIKDPVALIDDKVGRFMSKGAGMIYLSMLQAIKQANLKYGNISNPRTGALIGTGGGSPKEVVLVADTIRNSGIKKLGIRFVIKTIPSASVANIVTLFGIKGISFCLSSACATSAHCIGEAFEKVLLGRQDVMFAGGTDESDWIIASNFDRIRALSTKYNDTPEKSSRPYDKDRDGFVLSGGAGIIVLEELEHALARGAEILAEIVGYGVSSDGEDMTRPSGEGGVRCMREAIENAGLTPSDISYINTHGTSTPVGDIVELRSIKEVFGENIPYISSTKSLTGHGLGASGVHEIIFSVIMLKNKFLASSHNIETIDPLAEGYPILQKRKDNFESNAILSNSFGFGGCNATLIIKPFLL